MIRVLKTKGKILTIIDRYSFIVSIENDKHRMNATISKNLKIYEGKEFNIGNSVIIEYSTLDLTKGRIHRDSFIF